MERARRDFPRLRGVDRAVVGRVQLGADVVRQRRGVRPVGHCRRRPVVERGEGGEAFDLPPGFGEMAELGGVVHEFRSRRSAEGGMVRAHRGGVAPDPPGFAEGLERARPVSRREQHQPLAQAYLVERGLELQRLPVGGRGVGVAPERLERAAPVGVGVEIAGPERQRAVEGIERPARIAGFRQRHAQIVPDAGVSRIVREQRPVGGGRLGRAPVAVKRRRAGETGALSHPSPRRAAPKPRGSGGCRRPRCGSRCRCAGRGRRPRCRPRCGRGGESSPGCGSRDRPIRTRNG